MGWIRKWWKNYIRNSQVGRELEQEMWNKAVDDIKRHMIVIDTDNTILSGSLIEIPKDKSGILMRGGHTQITGCTIMGTYKRAITAGKTRAEIRLLKDIDKAHGRWAIMYGKGMVVTEAAIKIGDAYFYGRSECSAHDTFNRKIGRVIALGHAWKAFKMNDMVPVNEIPREIRQKEDK